MVSERATRRSGVSHAGMWGVLLSHDERSRIISEEEGESLLALVGGEAQTRGFQFDKDA